MTKYIYPEAESWMWDYCVYLGPFKSSDGKLYDLGVYADPQGRLSAAIVFGNEPGDYMSGDVDFGGEVYEECFHRAHLAGL